MCSSGKEGCTNTDIACQERRSQRESPNRAVIERLSRGLFQPFSIRVAMIRWRVSLWDGRLSCFSGLFEKRNYEKNRICQFGL